MYQYRQVLVRMRQGDTDRDIERSGQLGNSHQLRRDAVERTIQNTYDRQRRQLEKRLAVLDERPRKGSVLTRFVDRLKRRDIEREEIRATLDNSAQREAERRQPLESAIAAERQAMTEQHAQQMRELTRAFDDARSRGYNIPENYCAPIGDRMNSRGPQYRMGPERQVRKPPRGESV